MSVDLDTQDPQFTQWVKMIEFATERAKMLERTVTFLKEEAAKDVARLAALTAERDQLAARLAEVTAERDEARRAAAGCRTALEDLNDDGVEYERDLIAATEREVAEAIATWIESLGAEFDPHDGYRIEMETTARHVRSNAWVRL